jgi:hypothetical protein
MEIFKLTPDAYSRDHGPVDDIVVPPARIVAEFGPAPPSTSDPRKISGEYKFTDESGRVFSLFDWKMTSLYDPNFPPPEYFWSREDDHVLEIGAAKGVDVFAFKEWLLSRLAGGT